MYLEGSELRLALVVLCLTIALDTANADETWTADWIFKSVPEGAVPLHSSHKVWRDPKRKIVMLDGEVCLRQGVLEMLACPRNTKEHESVIVVDASPQIVHEGLLAIGAEPGRPVRYDPYQAASGTPIKIILVWLDESGKRRSAPAQDWVQNVKTGKAMDNGWVFAGSRFVRDQETGRKFYLADAGDFICISNFSSAAIDVPVKSSQENSSLLFQAFTGNIPKEKTRVRLVLIPEGKPPTIVAESK
jgi:hypothetical protein